MAVLALCLVFLLAMAGYSSAAYCACNTGLSDSVLQKNIDYACGAGADCGQIQQNGPCFNPNTVKDHCNFAVNSYYQKKGEVQGSCDFSGTAAVTQTAPSGQSSSCFPASPSGGGGGTTPPGNSTPNTGTTPPGNSTPNTGTPPPGSSTPNTGTNTGTTTPGINTNPSFGGLGPTTGTGFGDNSAAHQTFYSLTLTLLFSGLVWLRVI